MRRFFSLLGQIYDQLIHMQMLQVNDLFNGSSSSMQALWKIIDGGTFTLFDGDNTLFDYHEEIRNFFFFFAALIPKAWEVAPGFEDEKVTVTSSDSELPCSRKANRGPKLFDEVDGKLIFTTARQARNVVRNRHGV